MSTFPVRVAAPLAALLLAGCGAGSASSAAPSVAVPTTTSGVMTSTTPLSTSPAATDATEQPSTPTATREDPAAVQRVRACRAADVTTVRERDGATGTSLLSFRIVARPGIRCRLGGYPRVTVVARGWTVRTLHSAPWDRGADPAPFVVRAGHDGSVTFGWMRLTWCPPGMAVDRLDVRMPGGGTLRLQGFGEPSCDLGPKAGAVVDRPVQVGRFLPAA